MEHKELIIILEMLRTQVDLTNQRINLLNERIDLIRDMLIAHMKGEAECETSQSD